jgi:hypothetical protein
MKIAVRLFLMLTLTLTIFTRTARSQGDLPKYVVAPSENVLLAVASQPNCPLLIEEPMLLIGTKPGLQPIFRYRLRNVGEKTVLRYSLVFWTSNGTGGSLGNGGKPVPEKILPVDVWQPPRENIDVLSLSDELRGTLKLTGHMQSVTVLMVRRVVFEDGTSYNADNTSEALGQFFERN